MEILEVASPSPGEGEVLVEVRRAAVCGTDIHVLYGLYSRVRPPVTVGHEFCGVVAQVGPKVQGWSPGDRVTVDSTAGFCGKCSFCRTGQTQLCNQRTGYGSSRDGGFASHVSVRQEALYRLPGHTSFQEGALCEPLACATHAVMGISSIRPDETALITGPGAIGLLVLQVAKAMGARILITGTRKDEQRLQLALRLGADHVFQVDRQDLHPFIGRLTDGKGVDLAFECSGFEGGAKDCLSSVKKGGDMIQVGLFGHPIPLN